MREKEINKYNSIIYYNRLWWMALVRFYIPCSTHTYAHATSTSDTTFAFVNLFERDITIR